MGCKQLTYLLVGMTVNNNNTPILTLCILLMDCLVVLPVASKTFLQVRVINKLSVYCDEYLVAEEASFYPLFYTRRTLQCSGIRAAITTTQLNTIISHYSAVLYILRMRTRLSFSLL